MKKKGFTLVELLAVIAILAILVLAVLPNVLGLYNQAQRNTFVTELQSIYSAAETQFMSDSMGVGSNAGVAYTRVGGVNVYGDDMKSNYKKSGSISDVYYHKIDLDGTTSIDFYIEFNLAGKVVAYFATDTKFQFAYVGDGLAKQDIVAKDIDKGYSTCGTTHFTVANNTGTKILTNIPATGVTTKSDGKEYCGGNYTLLSFQNANKTITIDAK